MLSSCTIYLGSHWASLQWDTGYKYIPGHLIEIQGATFPMGTHTFNMLAKLPLYFEHGEVRMVLD